MLLLAVAAWRTDGRLPLGLLGRWAIAQAVAVLLFLPWLGYAWHTLRDWPAISPPVTAAFVAAESGATLALGARVPPEIQLWGSLLVAMAMVGLVAGLMVPRWRLGVVAAALWAAIPPALVWLLSLSRPAWNVKQLIAAAPGWELLLGAAVMAGPALAEQRAAARGETLSAGHRRVAQQVGVVLLLVLATPRVAALRAMYFDPAYQRDDYRGIAAEIERLAGAADAVVLNAPTQVEIFGYYDRGRHATYPLPLTRPADRRDTETRLAAIAAEHRDLYGVLWATDESDPEGIVEGWLNAHRYKLSDTWHGNVRLAAWAQARPMARVDLPPGGMRLGDDMALTRLARPTGPVPPGGILTLEADWQATAATDRDYVVFAQLLDAAGGLVAQRDMAPVGGTGHTSTWAPGTVVTDRIGLRVPPDVAAGDYTLIVGLYDPATGERLPVLDGVSRGADHVVAGEVRVQP